MALLLRNTRPYLLPLLRCSRSTSALAGRTSSSGGNRVPFRSPAGLGFRDGEALGEGKLRRVKGITTFSTSATPTTAPHCDTDKPVNQLREVPEDGFDYENANYGFTERSAEMAQEIMVTFLGTSSGGGPTKTRNCSSLVVDTLGDGSLWSAYYLSICPSLCFPYAILTG